ncbi:alpha/beta hydrolase [Novosphingobium sediminis]|nr:alpha/beta hydrolase [Novosphingobium sediminis]
MADALTPARKPRRRWLGWTLATLALLGVGGFLLYRQALATEAVAMLDSADRILRGGDGSIREVAAVRYGSDPAQKLEMFLPADADAAKGPLPIIVFIHGGGWRSGDPHDYRFMARALAPQGYAVVLAGYRLYPKAQYPGMLEDGAAALRWVADHAGPLGGDPRRVVLMGHSAGAYNAVMLGLDKRWLAARSLDADALRGVVGLSGPYDFYPFESEATKLSFGKAPNPEETQPVVHARAGGPPLLLVHGTADTRVRPRNSVELARTMTRAGAPTQAVLIDGVTHEGLIMLFARPFSHDPRAIDAVLPFLAKVTASPAVQATGG